MLGLHQAEKFMLCSQTFYLFPEKVIYWEEQKSILIADLHLGKAAHFRKEGIAIPEVLMEKSLEKLDKVIEFLDIESIIFLGDLFHSEWNSDWSTFRNWISNYSYKFILVKGNHDILQPQKYLEAGMVLKEEPWRLGPFNLSHHPLEEEADVYNLCGHLHPGIKLKGKGRQRVTLPCFYFGEKKGVLPAFSNFSGKHLLKINKTDVVFGITDQKVLRFN